MSGNSNDENALPTSASSGDMNSLLAAAAACAEENMNPNADTTMNDDDDNDDNDRTLDESIDLNSSTLLPGMPQKKPAKAKWTAEEDQILREAVGRQNGKNWKLISKYVEGKTEVQCLHRWTKVLNPELTKGPWTQEVRTHS